MDLPPPKYTTFEAFLQSTPRALIRNWCTQKAKHANRYKVMPGVPVERINTEDVWNLLIQAKGRCHYCNSLAVEKAPTDPITGKTLPWEQVGRRIGSVDHVIARLDSGRNHMSNLVWCCHWCNTHPSQRIKNAKDYGAVPEFPN